MFVNGSSDTRRDSLEAALFPAWYHAVAFTSAQSTEQDTNVSSINVEIFVFLLGQSV